MMTKKRLLAAAVAALFLGLATVPASAGRFSALKHAFKQAQNAADLHNFGTDAHKFSQGFEWSGFQRRADHSDILRELEGFAESASEAHEMSEMMKHFCGDDKEATEGALCRPTAKSDQQIHVSEELRELMVSPIILSPEVPVQWQEPDQ